jgi:thiol-disulfide isomerase/thioredoxin
MLSRLSILALLAVSFTAPGLVLADDSPPPIDEMIKKAKKAGKPLVIDFYATWCAPCKVFDKDVLPREDVKKALGDVVFIKYDAEAGTGLEAADRYGISAYPTFVVVDEAGNARFTDTGAMTSEKFIRWLAQAQVAVLSGPEVKALVKSHGSDPNKLFMAARWYRSDSQPKEADRLYRKVIALDPGNKKGLAADAAWECTELNLYHSVRKRIVESRLSYASRFPSSDRALSAFLMAAWSGRYSKAKLDAVANRIASEMPVEGTNGAVYKFLATKNHDAALHAAERQVDATPKDANAYDTIAEVHHVRGETKQAVQQSQKAIALGPTHKSAKVFVKNLERFKKGLGADEGANISQDKERVLRFLSELPGDDPSYAYVVPPPSAMAKASRQKRTDARTFRQAIGKEFSAVGTQCALVAGKTKSAYARVELADDAGKPGKVWILEPGISRKLLRCLTNNLKNRSFPKPVDDERVFTRVTPLEKNK